MEQLNPVIYRYSAFVRREDRVWGEFSIQFGGDVKLDSRL